MTKIVITPMPEKIRAIPKKWRPMHPPINFFQDCGPGEPTPEDYAIAAEMFELLDPESQEYWGGDNVLTRLKENSVKKSRKTPARGATKHRMNKS
ncbi:MAG: hypothetical protein BWY84_00059 [Candidatus Aerophobetes bacterium ADurb.Bin490]|mgnify:CR=1 FL=1|nr:MAG: hypothetical protein BWY84_00059 [Candidatus Aerophobetes bacterium ADurb.Bin490]